MSDHRSPSEAHPQGDPPGTPPSARPTDSTPASDGDALALLDECLASMADDDPRQRLLYKLRHLLLQEAVAGQQREEELGKFKAVVEKLTAPANRVGTLLELPGEEVARIAVGGAEYYTNIDPRVPAAELRIGVQVLVNEAYALIKTLGYDRTGPVLKLAECLADGRLRFEQEPGRQALILQRSSELAQADLKPGDHLRIDPAHRIAIERIDERRDDRHLLDETPSVSWEQIGGQRQAIDAIRKAIEYPLVHADTFAKYRFTQPKGFLLHGPPGCGKTLIGQAAAASLAQAMGEASVDSAGRPKVTRGVFLHVKGPEILNMWLGESERMIRDLFDQARARRAEGALPFIFLDEAESILGTRRAMRSLNISNTLVPMFCSELDGIDSLRDVVVILASNRPDLIDPAVLRPGRIDRKIKVARPGKEQAAEILRVYLTPDLPLSPALLRAEEGDRTRACERLVQDTVGAIFRRVDEHRLLSVRLRSGQTRVLYRGDLVSGAILASIVQRAKERAIDRAIGPPPAQRQAAPDGDGLTVEDLLDSVETEFRDGEILPPDDASDEWLKLLDHNPDQVVGLSSFKSGRLMRERPIGQII